VVPNSSGTVSAKTPEVYEIEVWQRCILQVFAEASVSANCFEFCSTESPLIIDIFAVPALDSLPLYWKSAFEELPGDGRLFSLKGRSLKGFFPPETAYIAVTFHDGRGLGKL
jgi:hypothetical protein